MSRVVAVCAVVGLFAIPAAAAADPIPVTGIVEQNADYGASVRLDRGSSHAGPMLAGNLSYAPAGGLKPRFASTAPGDAAAALASGNYNPAPIEVVAPFVAAPVAAAPMTNAEVSQAFRDAFGTVSAAEIAADDLAPIIGAMEATDAMAVGSLGAQTEFTNVAAPAAQEVHASEPATLILLGSGLLALARRQRAKNATGVSRQ